MYVTGLNSVDVNWVSYLYFKNPTTTRDECEIWVCSGDPIKPIPRQTGVGHRLPPWYEVQNFWTVRHIFTSPSILTRSSTMDTDNNVVQMCMWPRHIHFWTSDVKENFTSKRDFSVTLLNITKNIFRYKGQSNITTKSICSQCPLYRSCTVSLNPSKWCQYEAEKILRKYWHCRFQIPIAPSLFYQDRKNTSI